MRRRESRDDRNVPLSDRVGADGVIVLYLVEDPDDVTRSHESIAEDVGPSDRV